MNIQELIVKASEIFKLISHDFNIMISKVSNMSAWEIVLNLFLTGLSLLFLTGIVIMTYRFLKNAIIIILGICAIPFLYTWIAIIWFIRLVKIVFIPFKYIGKLIFKKNNKVDYK